MANSGITNFYKVYNNNRKNKNGKFRKLQIFIRFIITIEKMKMNYIYLKLENFFVALGMTQKKYLS